jgi:hypothetical protein
MRDVDMLQDSIIKFANTDIMVDEIISMYEISKDIEQVEEIMVFLEEHDHLLPILEEAKEKIISVFGDEIKISLELHHDPEEAWDELFIVIKSSHSPKEAIELEKKLAKDWFISRIRDTKGDLNISGESL